MHRHAPGAARAVSRAARLRCALRKRGGAPPNQRVAATGAPLRAMEIDQQFVVGWGTLSLINAGLAQGKGRSGFAWWFVSLLLGPIATFLLVLLDRVEPE